MPRLETFKLLFKSAKKKMNVFVSELNWKKTFTFLFFLFLSFVFWMLQSMQEDYEMQITVPFSCNIPPEMAFIETPPAYITARIRDRGNALLNYSLRKTYINVDADMPAGGTGKIVLSPSDLEAELLKKLSPATSLLNFSPQQISLSYSKRKEKRLPVVFDGDVVTAPGYTVSGEMSFEPAEVDVSGGDSVIDTLTEIHTEYVEIKNAEKTISRKVKLQSTGGIVIVPDAISILVPVEEYTEKTFDIHVSGVDVPEGYAIRMFPSFVKITCNVPVSLFREVSANTFAVEVSLADLDSLHPNILPLKIKEKPSWIKQISLSQESIEFILEQAQ
jgi:hypothetical protein